MPSVWSAWKWLRKMEVTSMKPERAFIICL
jgi:hypothetical protein